LSFAIDVGKGTMGGRGHCPLMSTYVLLCPPMSSNVHLCPFMSTYVHLRNRRDFLGALHLELLEVAFQQFLFCPDVRRVDVFPHVYPSALASPSQFHRPSVGVLEHLVEVLLAVGYGALADQKIVDHEPQHVAFSIVVEEVAVVQL